MMNIKVISLAAVATALATTVSAATISVDFENEFPLVSDPTVLVGPYTNNGVTFTSLDGQSLQLNQTGGAPTSAFVPKDTVRPLGAFGEIFLGGDFELNSSIQMSFARSVKDLSFDIADIDGAEAANQTETFNIDFFLNGGLVGSVAKTAGVDADTGNAVVTTISFGGIFDTVQISNSTPGGTRNIGYGIDNIEAAIVPLPAGALLMLTGLGAFGAMRRRKKA